MYKKALKIKVCYLRVVEHMKYEFWESSMPNIKNISPKYSSIKKKLNTLELIKI